MNKPIVAQSLLLALLLSACTNPADVPIPGFPQGGILTQTYPLTAGAKAKLEGVYLVESGADRFGDRVVMKWAGDYLSVFTGKNVGYFVMKGGSLDSVVFLEGYWRYQNSTETGLAQMMVGRDEGGAVRARRYSADRARCGSAGISAVATVCRINPSCSAMSARSPHRFSQRNSRLLRTGPEEEPRTISRHRRIPWSSSRSPSGSGPPAWR